jgi:O-antigen ligase
MLDKKALLSLLILALATATIWNPFATSCAIGGSVLLIAFYRWPLLGLILTILTASLGEFGRLTIGGISFLALDLLAPTVLGIFLLRQLLNKKPICPGQIGWALLIFWLVAALSLLIGSFDLSTAEMKIALLHLLRFIATSGLFFVAQELVNSRQQILGSMLTAGLILSGSGFYLLALIPDFTEAGLADLGWDPHIGRLTGTFLDPNFAAGFLAFLLGFAGAWFLQVKKVLQQFWLVSIAGILLAAFFYTFSRSGLLALGATIFVLGIMKNRTLLVGLIIVAILGVGASSRLQERLGELAGSAISLGTTSQTVLDPTAQLRVDSWREALRIWGDNPLLGTGYGAYQTQQTFVEEESHAATGSDASLLNVAATTGILGLLAFLFLIWQIGRAAWQTRQELMSLGLLAAGTGLLVHSIFVNSLFFAPLTLLLFISTGLVKNEKKT